MWRWQFQRAKLIRQELFLAFTPVALANCTLQRFGDAPDSLLNDVEQRVVEFHKVEDPRFIETVRRLRRLFYIAHVHQNNFGCEPGLDPFTTSYFEVLFVNKRLAQPDPAARAPGTHPLDAANAAWLPDCQELKAADRSSELALFRRWHRRVAREAIPGLGL